MLADITFTVDLLPEEIDGLKLACKMPDIDIAKQLNISLVKLEDMFAQLWLTINLAEAAHDGRITIALQSLKEIKRHHA